MIVFQLKDGTNRLVFLLVL